MAPPAVTLYELSVFLHIAAAVVGLGSTFALSIAFPVALRVNQRNLPYVHHLSLAVSKWLATPGLVVVLATGLYQVIDADWSLGDFWLSAAFAIVIALGGIIGAYFMPADRKLAAMAEREIAAAGGGEVSRSEEYQGRARLEGIMGGVAGVLVIVAVYLMVTKPGL